MSGHAEVGTRADTGSWDPAAYLAFEEPRSRPFLDLIQRVPGRAHSIVDLGCGPGHLTAVLRARCPEADITGIDSSADMIDKAAGDNTDPKTTYELADVSTWQPEAPVDLIVSNALFQWVPEQFAVIERLSEHTGVFAIGVPNNFDAPSHALLREIGQQSPYAEHLRGIEWRRGNRAQIYLDLFADLGWSVDAWETTYLHVLQGEDPVFAWIAGTGARPVLQALPADLRGRFETAYRAALREAYPTNADGTVLPFTRVFVVATVR